MLLLRLPKQLHSVAVSKIGYCFASTVCPAVCSGCNPTCFEVARSNTDIEQAKRVVLILDDSLSMDRQIEGLNLTQTAFTAARSAMVEQVKRMPEGVEPGLS